MKGRRPKSLADLESGGTFRKDRHAHLVGAGATGLPSLSGPPPDELDEHGAAEWTRVVAAVQPGHLTEAERALVIGYCFWYGLFVRAAGELAREGVFPKRKTKAADGADDSERASKWLRIASESSTFVTRIASLLALTPVDRNRVARIAPPAPTPAPVRPLSYLDRLGPIRPIHPADDAG